MNIFCIYLNCIIWTSIIIEETKSFIILSNLFSSSKLNFLPVPTASLKTQDDTFLSKELSPIESLLIEDVTCREEKNEHYKRSAFRVVKICTSILFCIILFFAINNTNKNSIVWATDDTKGMGCVAVHCSKDLSKCLSNGQCAQGLGCFIRCSTTRSDIATLGEGDCQVRCMDLYQNSLLDKFTECSLTKYQCYEPLDADPRYPKLPTSLYDKRLIKDSGELNANVLSALFQGRWYIVGGLNPAFDTFDCQVHDFYKPSVQRSNHDIADATFSYRIKKSDDDFFTKTGDKKLTIVKTEPDTKQEFDVMKALVNDKKAWGKDIFEISSNLNLKIRDSTKAVERLQLKLQPNQMKYKDDWIVLSYSTDPSTPFIVVAYRGTNSAWNGYGGVNLYMKQPIDIRSLENSNIPKSMINEIEQGLGKIGLTIKDLIPIDNQCI